MSAPLYRSLEDAWAQIMDQRGWTSDHPLAALRVAFFSGAHICYTLLAQNDEIAAATILDLKAFETKALDRKPPEAR